MKKTEFISVLSAAALIIGTFGACSHNKDKEAASSSPEYSASESQNQDQSQASANTDAATASETASTDQMATGGQMSTEQTEQGGTTSTQTTDQNAQWNWRTMQSELLNETVVNYLHHVNQKEIQMSQWAQEKAQSQQVKNAAQQMLKDHQALETSVQQLATQRNWTLRSFQPATWELVVTERIQGLSGDQFDQAFIGTVHAEHEHALQELAWANSKIKDQSVKSLVRQTLQRVRAHRQMTAPMHRSLASGKWKSQSPDMSTSEQTTTEQGGQEMPEQGAPTGAEDSIDQAPTKDNGN